MGASASTGEKQPLTESKEPPAPAPAPAPEASASDFASRALKLAVPLSITFYIFVAVLKTMLTKALFETASAAIGFSLVSTVSTCIILIPVFLIYPSTWGTISKANLPGFCLVAMLVTFDLAFTNIAVSLLPLALQQCILATNPAFTVSIESVVKRKLYHPVIYATIALLCVGPVIMQIGKPASDINVVGILAQLAGVTFSACKYVFTHSVMQRCKKDCSSFAFLFWVDAFTILILLPWSLANNELVTLLKIPHNAGAWVSLFFTAVLGGVRFFSQIIVLRFTTATNLSIANLAFQAINIYFSMLLGVFHLLTPHKVTAGVIAGSLLTLATSGWYTYLKISKVLTKHPKCIKLDESFSSCVRCGGKSGDAV